MTYKELKVGDMVEAMGYYGIITNKYKLGDKDTIALYWFASPCPKDSFVKIPQFVTVWDKDSIGKLSLVSR